MEHLLSGKIKMVKKIRCKIIMKKIDLYIIKRFLSTFFLTIGLILIVVIIFDISEKIDDFLESEVGLNKIIFKYYLNFIFYKSI